jgi:hypothetical protein
MFTYLALVGININYAAQAAPLIDTGSEVYDIDWFNDDGQVTHTFVKDLVYWMGVALILKIIWITIIKTDEQLRQVRRDRKREIKEIQRRILKGTCYGNMVNKPEMREFSHIQVNQFHDEQARINMNCHHYKDMAFQAGPVLKDYIPVLTSKCLCNEILTVCDRCTRDPPKKVNRGAMNDFINFIIDDFDLLFPVWVRGRGRSTEEWVNKLTGKKKEEMILAANMLHTTKKTKLYRKKIRKIKAFMKKECLVQRKTKSPRMISGRHNEFNAKWGRLVSDVSDLIKNVWRWKPSEKSLDFAFYNNCKLATYYNGYTRDEGGEWVKDNMEYIRRFGEPATYCTDFSKYDVSQSEWIHKLQMLIIKMLFPDLTQDEDEALWDTGFTQGRLGDVLYNIGKRRGILKSGDQWTSLINSITTACLITYQIHKSTGHTMRSIIEGPFRMMVLGDDSLLLTTEYFRDEIEKYDYLGDLGIKVTVEGTDINHMSFCSHWLVPCTVNGEDSYMMTPKPGRIFYKTFYSYKPLGYKKAMGYARGVAEGFVHDYGHIPWMKRALETVIKNVQDEGIKQYIVEDKPWLKHSKYVAEPNDATYQWMLEVWGLDKDDVLELSLQLERELEHSTFAILDLDLLNQVVDADNECRVGS